MVQAFCETLESNGYYVSVYTNLSILRHGLSQNIRTRYDIWLAQWASQPTYSGAFGMWQYSASGTVTGIRGAVDLDIAYKNYPAIMRQNGLNGFENKARSAEAEPYAGMPVVLQQEKLYSTSTAPFHTARISGTYYLYGVPAVHDRYGVTSKASRVGKKPEWLHTIGWIDADTVREQNTLVKSPITL